VDSEVLGPNTKKYMIARVSSHKSKPSYSDIQWKVDVQEAIFLINKLKLKHPNNNYLLLVVDEIRYL